MKTNLKYLRELNGLTTRELADKLPDKVITHSQISRVEVGKSKLTFNQIVAMCDFFDVTSDFLLGLSDDPSPRTTIFYREVNLNEKITLIELLEKYSGVEIIINYTANEILIIENPLSVNRKIILYKKI